MALRRQRLPRRITVAVGIASLCGIVFVPFHLGSVTTIAPPPERLVPLTAALPLMLAMTLARMRVAALPVAGMLP